MTGITGRREQGDPARPLRERISAGVVSAVAIVLLGMLAAPLVLIAVPRAFGIEWACIGETGVQRTAGDTYIEALAVLGTIGWLAVLVGAIYASIAERRRLVVLLPTLWFVSLVSAALVAAAAVGPAPCPP